jgi:hypothetical protein
MDHGQTAKFGANMPTIELQTGILTNCFLEQGHDRSLQYEAASGTLVRLLSLIGISVSLLSPKRLRAILIKGYANFCVFVRL